jgi:hypothetical protein
MVAALLLLLLGSTCERYFLLVIIPDPRFPDGKTSQRLTAFFLPARAVPQAAQIGCFKQALGVYCWMTGFFQFQKRHLKHCFFDRRKVTQLHKRRLVSVCARIF